MSIYVYTCLSDFIDGYLARRWKVESKEGQVLDIFGDKYLTIVSILYAVGRGVNVIPCALIILKEIALLAIRQLASSKIDILKPNKFLGVIFTFPIWVMTFFAINIGVLNNYFNTILIIFYWAWGFFAILNITFRVFADWSKIKQIYK